MPASLGSLINHNRRLEVIDTGKHLENNPATDQICEWAEIAIYNRQLPAYFLPTTLLSGLQSRHHNTHQFVLQLLDCYAKSKRPSTYIMISSLFNVAALPEA